MLGLIDRMVGIVRTNSLGFGKILGLCTGHALCPTFSLLSHDCMSNCRYAAKELDEQDEAEKKGPRNTILVQVRAMKRIQKGEELTVQYKGSLLGKDDDAAFKFGGVCLLYTFYYYFCITYKILLFSIVSNAIQIPATLYVHIQNPAETDCATRMSKRP